MENECIRREAAERVICEVCDRPGCPRLWGNDCDRIDRLNTIPAADVRPVKHGHWVKAKGSWCTPGGDPVWECSECGKGTHVYGIEHGTYGADVADGQWIACPNCGAKMDGGVNDGRD